MQPPDGFDCERFVDRACATGTACARIVSIELDNMYYVVIEEGKKKKNALSYHRRFQDNFGRFVHFWVDFAQSLEGGRAGLAAGGWFL